MQKKTTIDTKVGKNIVLVGDEKTNGIDRA